RHSSSTRATATSPTSPSLHDALPICTFTNHRLPQVKLAKTLDPTTDPGTFDLSAGSQSFNNGGNGYGNGQDTGFHNVPQGSLLIDRKSTRLNTSHVDNSYASFHSNKK